MSMYVGRGPLGSARDLEQGDLLANALLPRVPLSSSVARTRLNAAGDHVLSEYPADFAADADELRTVQHLKRCLAIVPSNSCDNHGGHVPLIVAPLQALALSSGKPAAQWREVQKRATSGEFPKLFYLPGSSTYGLNRGNVLLSSLTHVSVDFMDRCIAGGGTRRICGLTPAAVVHLQWALGQLFGRSPRDDFAWPARDYYALKLASVDAELAKNDVEPARRTELLAERAAIQQRLDDPATD